LAGSRCPPVNSPVSHTLGIRVLSQFEAYRRLPIGIEVAKMAALRSNWDTTGFRLRWTFGIRRKPFRFPLTIFIIINITGYKS